MSLVVPHSLSNNEPKYSNSFASSTCLPLISIRWSTLAFTRMTFDFLALILRRTLAASSASLLVLSLMSTYLRRQQSDIMAKSKSSKIEVNVHRIQIFLPSVVLPMIQSESAVFLFDRVVWKGPLIKG